MGEMNRGLAMSSLAAASRPARSEYRIALSDSPAPMLWWASFARSGEAVALSSRKESSLR